ncbi:MAG: hypothetical protein DELT_00584 [Desulfovibrio sp.]
MKYMKKICIILAVPALATAIFAGGFDPYHTDSIIALVGIMAAIAAVSFICKMVKMARPMLAHMKQMIAEIRHPKDGHFPAVEAVGSPLAFYGIEEEERRKTYCYMLKSWGLTAETAPTARKISGWSLFPVGVITLLCAYAFISHLSFAALFGFVVGLVGFIAIFWRWRCLSHQEYMHPWTFIKQAGRGFSPIVPFVFVLALAFSAPEVAYADTDISLPSQMEVEKKDDLSANIFAHLFGTAWQAGAGAGTGGLINSEQLGAYSELILNILAVLNAAAMLFVGVAVIYMSAIFMVITAHEGKSLGGSMFNSLWIPVRFAFAMSLTAPVLKGLSLLQIGLLGCLGLGINMANSVWDVAGEHIVNHAHVKIVEGSPSYVEHEAKTLVAPMLKSAAMQEAIMYHSSAKWPKITTTYDNKVLGLTPLEKYDYLYTYHQSQTGKHRILYTPAQGMQIDEIGGFVFDYPAGGENPAYSKEVYTAKKNIADARGEALVEMAEAMRVHACDYIVRNGGAAGVNLMTGEPYLSYRGKQGKAECGTPDSIENIIAQYAEKMRTATAANAAAIVDGSDMTTLLSRAIDHDGSSSKFGWVSAGMFAFTMSSLQKQYDDVLAGNGVSYEFANDSILHDGGVWKSGLFTADRIDRNVTKIIQGIDDFSEGIFNDSFYIRKSNYKSDGSATTAFKKVVSGFSEKLTSMFASAATEGNTGGANGILAVTLYQFKKHDPLVVLTWMGNNLLDMGLWLVAFDAGFSIFGVDIAILSAAGLGLCLIGIIFAYVAPIMPFLFWISALFGWVFLVLESMVAAPLWAAAHALPEGQGLAGQHARRGYLMAFDIVLRPTLLVIGAVTSIAVMQAFGWFCGTLLDSFFVNIASFLQFGVIGELIFTIILVSVMFHTSIKIYTKGIVSMPQKVISWIGGQGASLGESDDSKSNHVVGAVVNQSGGATASTIKKGAGMAGGAAGGILKKAGGKLGGILKNRGGQEKPA